jgi:thiosulfate reductase cytochrome b subunit
VLPLIVLGGWAMSPMIDSFAPGWVDLLGGRQAARTLHFIAAVLLVAFVLIHVFEVIVTGLVNNLRSMVTGYWRLPK